jgi:hypothetical protein
MRRTLMTLALIAVAGPLAAQQQMGGMNDPTKQIKGSGQLPSGWQMRFDPVLPGRGGVMPAVTTHDITEVDVKTMGSGLHFTTGPAAIYYNTKDVGTGEYAVTATFSQRKSVAHEAYGMFIGGANLQDSTQSYIYFVIKPCHSRCGNPGLTLGEILISRRSSNGRPQAIVPLTHDDAIVTDDPTDGHATNKMTIHVAKDTVHFMLNDKLVRAVPKSQLGGPTDGQAGLRINHNIDVHVDWKGVTK